MDEITPLKETQQKKDPTPTKAKPSTPAKKLSTIREEPKDMSEEEEIAPRSARKRKILDSDN